MDQNSSTSNQHLFSPTRSFWNGLKITIFAVCLLANCSIERSCENVVEGLVKILEIALLWGGAHHTCAISEDQELKCWGGNYWEQCGSDYKIALNTPTNVENLSGTVSTVHVGENHTCVITEEGTALCWGYEFGDYVEDTDEYSSPPTEIAWNGEITFIQIDGAMRQSLCAVTSGKEVKCVFSAYDAPGGLESFPVIVTGTVELSVGAGEACALVEGGEVLCWPLFGGGHRDVEYVEALTGQVVDISVGAFTSCAVMSTGSVKCWGINRYGQLGNGTEEYSRIPVDVIDLPAEASAVAVGSNHACAIVAGEVWCWGNNENGRLGDGTNENSSVPVRVTGISGIIAISSGSMHTCALTSYGGVKCWGWNEFGQLGDGTEEDSNIPVDVVGLESGVIAISAGSE